MMQPMSQNQNRQSSTSSVRRQLRSGRTWILLALIIGGLVAWVSGICEPGRGKQPEPGSKTDAIETTVTPETTVQVTLTETVSPQETTALTETTADWMEGRALFIGDSRTVGLMEYAGLENTDFFADTGMTVFDVCDKSLSVSGAGSMTLEQLLTEREYRRIYLMLGINELGYDFDTLMAYYEHLVQLVREKQPDAAVICQANLHVTRRRSESDGVINNPALDRLNAAIKTLTVNYGIFYLDANVLFDDEDGALSEEKSADAAHPLAKYYSDWGEWIISRTETLLKR